MHAYTLTQSSCSPRTRTYVRNFWSAGGQRPSTYKLQRPETYLTKLTAPPPPRRRRRPIYATSFFAAQQPCMCVLHDPSTTCENHRSTIRPVSSLKFTTSIYNIYAGMTHAGYLVWINLCHGIRLEASPNSSSSLAAGQYITSSSKRQMQFY
jgi:hypothetical protein